jgi:hypothetical protein
MKVPVADIPKRARPAETIRVSFIPLPTSASAVAMCHKTLRRSTR